MQLWWYSAWVGIGSEFWKNPSHMNKIMEGGPETAPHMDIEREGESQLAVIAMITQLESSDPDRRVAWVPRNTRQMSGTIGPPIT